MIEGVPGGAPDGKTRAPRLLRVARLGNGLAMHDRRQRREECRPEPLQRPRWVTHDSLRRSRSKLAEVRLIGLADVVDDLRQVATSTSRALPQALPAGLVRRLVERLPARGQALGAAPALLVLARPPTGGHSHSARAGLGRGRSA